MFPLKLMIIDTSIPWASITLMLNIIQRLSITFHSILFRNKSNIDYLEGFWINQSHLKRA